MTTLTNGERSTALQERIEIKKRPRIEAPNRKANRLRKWMASLLAFLVVGTGAVAVTVNQGDAAELLSYRVIGEAEALQRFVPGVAAASAVEAGLSYRVIGEAEALQRFVPSV